MLLLLVDSGNVSLGDDVPGPHELPRAVGNALFVVLGEGCCRERDTPLEAVVRERVHKGSCVVSCDFLRDIRFDLADNLGLIWRQLWLLLRLFLFTAQT